MEDTARGSTPSAPLGVYVAGFLTRRLPLNVRSAKLGIIFANALLQHDEGQDSESLDLITKLNAILHMNLTDHLNRSSNRALALQEYLDTVVALSSKGKRTHAELEARLTARKVELRGERKTVKGLERTIDKASRKGDFSIAGMKSQELEERQGSLKDLEVEEETLERLVDTYSELMEMADERLAAILANREVLIAGVRVKEVDGLDALGIVEGGRRRRR